MRAVSELTSAMVILAITLSATAGALSYYAQWVDSAWYDAKKRYLEDVYRTGLKISLIAYNESGEIWLFNYGWEKAYVQAIEIDGLNSTSWSIYDASSGDPLNYIPPSTLVKIEVPSFSQVKIYFKGGVKLEI